MPETATNVQDAMMALEVYQRQLDMVSRQIEVLQGALDEIVRARRSLEALSDEKSNDVLVPVGSSTFLRASLKDRDTVITGIGAGYATEKTREDTIKRLVEREAQVNQDLERMMQGAVQLQQEAAELQERIETAQG